MSYQPYLSGRQREGDTAVSGDLRARLQSILDTAVNEFKLPGIQAGVLFSDGLSVSVASGTVDFGRRGAEITTGSIFKIGSTTKLFVSALVGRLVEKGLLDYTDTLDKWFPEFGPASTITIGSLLNHTSGITDNLFSNPAFMIESGMNPGKRWDPAYLVAKMIPGMKVEKEGKRGFSYANNNYIFLGLIAEKAGEATLAEQLRREFFIPLKMNHSFLLPYYGAIPPGLIAGYDEYIPFGPHLLSPDNTAWDTLTFSAGAMASTAEDLLVWLDALFHDKVLKPETLARMRVYISAERNERDESITGYGLGVAMYALAGRELEGHPGGGFGGECFPFYYRAGDFSIVVSYNLSRKDNPAGKRVLERILKEVETYRRAEG